MNGAPPLRVGTVGVVGRPSTGKSSLINRICGHKVSIVSPVPQTTRSRVRGIVTLDAGQLIFLDTPGLHASDRKLNLVLKKVALSVADEVDLLLLLFDVSRPFGAEDDAVLSATRRFAGHRLAACNKVDLPATLADVKARHSHLRSADIEEIHPVSALSGAGVPALVARLLELSPTGDLLYPDDMYTDQTPDFRVAEIVREHAFARTTAEVPHALYVEVVDLEQQSGRLWVRATIWVEPKCRTRCTSRWWIWNSSPGGSGCAPPSGWSGPARSASWWAAAAPASPPSGTPPPPTSLTSSGAASSSTCASRCARSGAATTPSCNNSAPAARCTPWNLGEQALEVVQKRRLFKEARSWSILGSVQRPHHTALFQPCGDAGLDPARVRPHVGQEPRLPVGVQLERQPPREPPAVVRASATGLPARSSAVTSCRLASWRSNPAIGTEPGSTTRERGCATQPWVEEVPHGVTEHVETVNGNGQA